MSKQLNNAINILFVVLVLLALGWVWGIISNWNEIVTRPVRLAYIICDFLIVMPLGFVSGWGLKNGKSWAKTLFPLALGALLFDIAHGIFYLIWDNYFGVPLILAFVLLIVFIGYLVYAMRALNSA